MGNAYLMGRHYTLRVSVFSYVNLRMTMINIIIITNRIPSLFIAFPPFPPKPPSFKLALNLKKVSQALPLKGNSLLLYLSILAFQ